MSGPDPPPPLPICQRWGLRTSSLDKPHGSGFRSVSVQDSLPKSYQKEKEKEEEEERFNLFVHDVYRAKGSKALYKPKTVT